MQSKAPAPRWGTPRGLRDRGVLVLRDGVELLLHVLEELLQDADDLAGARDGGARVGVHGEEVRERLAVVAVRLRALRISAGPRRASSILLQRCFRAVCDRRSFAPGSCLTIFPRASDLYTLT